MEEERKIVEETVVEEEKKTKKGNLSNIRISLKSILVIVLVLALMGGSFFGGYKLAKHIYSEGEVTTGFLVEQIETCSDLIVAKDTITGTVKFKKGSIPVINKKSFTMLYVATVKAKIDIEKVDPQVDGKNITVYVPHATIDDDDITINPNTIQFFDDSGSIFNHRNHEDVKVTLKRAKNDAKTKIHSEELLEKADDHIKDVLGELLHFVQEEGYKLNIKFKK